MGQDYGFEKVGGMGKTIENGNMNKESLDCRFSLWMDSRFFQ